VASAIHLLKWVLIQVWRRGARTTAEGNWPDRLETGRHQLKTSSGRLFDLWTLARRLPPTRLVGLESDEAAPFEHPLGGALTLLVGRAGPGESAASEDPHDDQRRFAMGRHRELGFLESLVPRQLRSERTFVDDPVQGRPGRDLLGPDALATW
jgi:hypothetical protein